MTIAQIAALTGARLPPGQAATRSIGNIAPLATARAGEISYLQDAGRVGELAATDASACLMPERFAAAAPARLIVLTTETPYRAFVMVARALFPAALAPSSLFEGGSGPTAGARVHRTARLEAGVAVDPFAAIGARAEIGAGTLIGAGALVGPGVCVGRNCTIGAGATIEHALIGDRVIIQPGARIGQDGFDFLSEAEGHRKIPQTRRVIIQDDVEIGANSVVARGWIRDTTLGEGTKVDNLVQIAHNVSIGRHCLIAAQAGIGAGVTMGDFVIMGARSAIAADVAIGDRAVLAGQGAVNGDIASGARIGPAPAKTRGARPPQGGGP